MNILNISTLKLNDAYTYYGGAIGSIAYNLMRNLSVIEGVDITTFVEGTDPKQELPESLEFLNNSKCYVISCNECGCKSVLNEILSR